MTTSPDSYDFEIFNVLAYEFAVDNPRTFDSKIRRMLSRKHLGPYNPARVSSLRNLKNYLQEEFRIPQNSDCYVGSISPTASVNDFNQAKLRSSVLQMLPTLSSEDAGRIASLALYLYYLR